MRSVLRWVALIFCVSCNGNAIQSSKSFWNSTVKDCKGAVHGLFVCDPKNIKTWVPIKLQVDSLLYHIQCAHARTYAFRKTNKAQNETLQIMIPSILLPAYPSSEGHIWIYLESFSINGIQFAALWPQALFLQAATKNRTGPKVQSSDHDG